METLFLKGAHSEIYIYITPVINLETYFQESIAGCAVLGASPAGGGVFGGGGGGTSSGGLFGTQQKSGGGLFGNSGSSGGALPSAREVPTN